VLTADRPPELRATGAVQTIDQSNLFGKYAKFYFDMPCPDVKIKPEAVLTTVDQLVYQAVRQSGVVHLNCMFRDPLAPVKTGEKFNAYLKTIDRWMKNRKPYTQYVTGFESIRIPNTKKIAERLNDIQNGLIVVGKIGGEEEQTAAVNFAKRLGWPIFADASSGLRLGNSDSHIIHYFDHILLSSKLIKKLKFDGIIHLGGRITSKRFYEFVAQCGPVEYVMVLNHSLRSDPQHQVTLRIESTVGNFCSTFAPLIKPRKPGANLKLLSKANAAADRAIEEFTTASEHLTEPAVARLLSQNIPQDHALFLANSMPIREIDFYADFKGSPVRTNGNRGASGIDGLVASAAGLSVGLDKPVTLFVGDLSLLHDLNSLSMLKGLKQPVVIVVINNDGGAIFSFLPIAGEKDVFEKFFATPHGVTFEDAARMFGLTYAKPDSARSFALAYERAVKGKGPVLIEVATNRDENVKIHKFLQERITRSVDKIS
jgi:2-succinyl-5-enolpyruvyl-6-hydroxy-3-cyclohexene-1-carboxylate synthase